MIGKRLAYFEITSRIGAGGMGEVYRASDTRLGREVAVKVLPETLARDPERIRRFEREAKLLASLNHRNIASLYGLEPFEAGHLLVMELIEGETLAEKLEAGPIPVKDALKFARQIAEALEAAHEKGIIHRDLKPSNIKVTPEGEIKVLDFGLAKAMDADAESQISNMPTISPTMTNAGVILGTAAYMSPEQARGRNADHRSDIFSFGSVLYEMLSGKQPFPGESIADVLAGVLASEPDLALLPQNLAPRIRDLIQRCLEKNPRRRWQAVGDVRVEIESILADPKGVIQTSPAEKQQSLAKRIAAVAAAFLLGAVLAGLGVWYLKPVKPAATARFSFILPQGQEFQAAPLKPVAVSPDGKSFAYAANNQLYLKAQDQLDPIAIAGTLNSGAGSLNPVFSPDGKSLAFYSFSDGLIKRIQVTGGAPMKIASLATPPSGLSWEANDELLIGTNQGIMRVNANGGTPETIVKVKDGETAYGPQRLPGRKEILFTLVPPAGGPNRVERARIVMQSPDATEPTPLMIDGRDARYLPTGHIVYAFGGNLLAIHFDLGKGKVTGSPVTVVEGVQAPTFASAGAQYAVSDTGTLVFIRGTAAATQQRSLFLTDRTGNTQTMKLPPGPYQTPRFSPTGKELAVVTSDGRETFVAIYDMTGAHALQRITPIGVNAQYPAWSGDSQYILYTVTNGSEPGIYRKRADGSGKEERLTKSDAGITDVAENWHPKEDVFSITRAAPGGNAIWTYSVSAGMMKEFFHRPGSNQDQGHFSPNGKWMVYNSEETGRYEIYLKPYPATEQVNPVTRDGGHHPVWSPLGGEIFYVNEGRLFSVSVQTDPTVLIKVPEALPIMGFVQNPGRGTRMYDIHPNGKQFVMVAANRTATTPASRPEVQVVLNWFEELIQKVGSR